MECRFGCKVIWDFSLEFEWIALTLVPAALFICVAVPRCYSLYFAAPKAKAGVLLYAKAAAAVINAGLLLAILVAAAIDEESRYPVSVAAKAVALVAGVAVGGLTVLEHRKSIRPSALVTVYLLLTILFDCINLRTQFRLIDNVLLNSLACASLASKVLLVLAEETNKRHLLFEPYNIYSKEATCGIVSWTMLWWLRDLFTAGYKRMLTLDDLEPLDYALSTKLMNTKADRVWRRRNQPERPHELIFTTLKCVKWELLAVVPPRLLLIGFSYAQTFLISAAVEYVSQSDRGIDPSAPLVLAAAAGVIFIGIAVTNMHYQQQFVRVQTMFRGAMVSLIFNKTLELADGDNTANGALSLMSTDVATIMNLTNKANEIYANAIQVLVGVYLLQRQLGVVCVIPLLITIASSFIQSYVAKNISGALQSWNGSIQERVTAVSRILSGMKSIKMMGLTKDTTTNLITRRAAEVKLGKRFMWFIVVLNVAAHLPEIWSPVCTFMAYLILDRIQGGQGHLDPSQLFTSMAIISLVTGPASKLLATIPQVAAVTGCFTRIQKFLLADTVIDSRIVMSAQNGHQVKPQNGHEANKPTNGTLKNMPVYGTFDGSSDVLGPALVCSNIAAKPGTAATAEITDITLELAPTQFLLVVGPTGCGKTTFLRAILGEIPLINGEVKISTSRVAYCSQSPWMFNGTVRENICGVGDPTNHEEESFDETWYQKVLHACAIDEDLEGMASGDDTNVGSNGLSLSGGQRQRIALARAVYSRSKLAIFDDTLSAVDFKTREAISQRLLGAQGLLKKTGTTVVMASNDVRDLSVADCVLAIDKNGKMTSFGPPAEELIHQLKNNEATITARNDEKAENKKTPPIPKVTPEDEMDRTRKLGDLAVYSYYIRSFGWPLFLGFLFLVVIGTAFSTATQIWIAQWVGSIDMSLGLFMGIYLLLALSQFLLNETAMWVNFTKTMPRSANRLHEILVRVTMNAPYSFFTSTDTGVTLNRFSQDMSLVDQALPAGLFSTTTKFFDCLASAGLIFVGSTYISAVLPFLFIALYFLQDIYLKTSRQLRYLELEAKSPLYSHLLEMINGLSTIRAYQWSEKMNGIMEYRLDRSQQPEYQLYCIQRWLNLVLNLIVAGLAVMVVALACSLRSSTSGILLGLALNNILSFGQSLSWLIQAWTGLETCLGAVARVRAFENRVVEEHLEKENLALAPNWPASGEIEFRDVSGGYPSNAKVLQGISLSIKSGEKIGICGRTGSGKSTLLLSILRLLDSESESGEITIDGQPLNRTPKNLVREALVTVPQEPFALPGSTVRQNCDPEGDSMDGDIISALEEVGLWEVLESRGGLDVELKSDTLSNGQLQLLCLARAIVRKGRIVLLDEPTSGVDPETDRKVQKVLKRVLEQTTVLTIAHRLDTILDYDRIVVMNEGRIVECDTPKALLSRDSAFKDMYNSK